MNGIQTKTTYTKTPGLGADGQERIRVAEAQKLKGVTLKEKVGFISCDPGTADAALEAINSNELAVVFGQKLTSGLYEVQVAPVEAPAA